MANVQEGGYDEDEDEGEDVHRGLKRSRSLR